jgi:beta-galactosidase/beta-glucuronidase
VASPGTTQPPIGDEPPYHPRPQLTRPRWTDLGGPWRFAYDDADVGLRDGWRDRPERFEREIVVPFPPESIASGIGDPAPHPVVWYRRTFRVEATDRTGRLLLHFGAVDYRADVWVNGRLVARHEGGHTPFSAEITSELLPGDVDQAIVVRAEDLPGDLAQPRGKQFWEASPRSIWYHRTTGIWQAVWLEPVGMTSIERIGWTPDLGSGLLGLRVELDRAPSRPLTLTCRLTLRGDLLAEDSYHIAKRELRRGIAIEPAVLSIGRRALLWAPSHPNLVDAVLTLRDGDEVVDEVRSYLGLRQVGVRAGLFELNRVPTYLRLVLGQGYWPSSHLAAPSDDALRRDVELIKSLGFNGVRIHQKVEDPRFLYWCDRLGLMVWGEMANAYVFSQTAVERLTREWLEVIRRDASHPSIVTWVPFNESWGVPDLPRDAAQRAFVRALYELTKALDPTRPVIGNDGWEHFAADILGIHDYALDGAALRERYGTVEALEATLSGVQPQHHSVSLGHQRSDEPVMLTEIGGISYAPEPGSNWFGYGTVTDEQSFIARYEEIVSAVLDSPVIAGFCYTQFSDTEQETNGLVDGERQPKADIDHIRRATQRASRAIPGDLISAVHTAAEVTGFGPGS